jgi:hypothetical protein
MKNIFLSAIIMAFVLVSCNKKDNQTETTNTPMMKDNHSKLYSCPMHPEVQGKLNDKCSKCGMKLTEEVK